MINTRKIELHGHRGARGLKPENTIPAFEKALQTGVHILELDVVLTKDKQVLIHHDTDLNPEICLHKSGKPLKKEPVSNFTLLELRELDCGSIRNLRFPEQELVANTPPPTLKELIDFVKSYESKNPSKDQIILNIELKFPPKTKPQSLREFAEIVSGLLNSEKFSDRVVLQSFEIDVLPILKSFNGKFKTSALFAPDKLDFIFIKYFNSKGFGNKIINKSLSVKADYVSPYYKILTIDFVNKAHSVNLKVLPWTINTKEEMQSAYELGVDGIISDYPNLLKEIFP